MDALEAKRTLHEAIDAAANSQTTQMPEGALVRWVVIAEFVHTGSRRSAVSMSGDAGGGALSTWDVDGLLFNSLYRQGRR